MVYTIKDIQPGACYSPQTNITWRSWRFVDPDYTESTELIVSVASFRAYRCSISAREISFSMVKIYLTKTSTAAKMAHGRKKDLVQLLESLHIIVSDGCRTLQ